ncbi:hypothetical protein Ahy_A02g005630 isoform C [Arachis hypogaea]|uniref:Uncharacterized protein n=1 Tax=Arachis hypogaea TaxID=3818 RepID=A0A445E7R0_ARAHY|nr:hypothetical protein Ahy_A02g005630 isoform C [Arachis hypogaea]
MVTEFAFSPISLILLNNKTALKILELKEYPDIIALKQMVGFSQWGFSSNTFRALLGRWHLEYIVMREVRFG